MFIFQEKNQIREKRDKERNIGKETKFAQLFRIERHQKFRIKTKKDYNVKNMEMEMIYDRK